MSGALGRSCRGFSLASYGRNDHLTLRGSRTAVTYAVRSERGIVRLLARVLFEPPGGRIGAATLGSALALGDLLMMRKQLLTLRALAERDARRAQRPRRALASGMVSQPPL